MLERIASCCKDLRGTQLLCRFSGVDEGRQAVVGEDFRPNFRDPVESREQSHDMT